MLTVPLQVDGLPISSEDTNLLESTTFEHEVRGGVMSSHVVLTRALRPGACNPCLQCRAFVILGYPLVQLHSLNPDFSRLVRTSFGNSPVTHVLTPMLLCGSELHLTITSTFDSGAEKLAPRPSALRCE